MLLLGQSDQIAELVEHAANCIVSAAVVTEALPIER
jgi:hypothetical protein